MPVNPYSSGVRARLAFGLSMVIDFDICRDLGVRARVPVHGTIGGKSAGEVWMSQAVMYGTDMTAEDHIEAAGGYTDRADKGGVIVHPDASVQIGDPDMPVEPGDEVLVPPKLDTKVVQHVLDVTQVIYLLLLRPRWCSPSNGVWRSSKCSS